jgi:hypothetical protein
MQNSKKASPVIVPFVFALTRRSLVFDPAALRSLADALIALAPPITHHPSRTDLSTVETTFSLTERKWRSVRCFWDFQQEQFKNSN